MCQGYQLPQAAHPQVLQAGEICTSKVLSRRPSMSHFLENIPRFCKCFPRSLTLFSKPSHIFLFGQQNSPFFVGNQKKRQEIWSKKSCFHVKSCFVHLQVVTPAPPAVPVHVPLTTTQVALPRHQTCMDNGLFGKKNAKHSVK